MRVIHSYACIHAHLYSTHTHTHTHTHTSTHTQTNMHKRTALTQAHIHIHAHAHPGACWPLHTWFKNRSGYKIGSSFSLYCNLIYYLFAPNCFIVKYCFLFQSENLEQRKSQATYVKGFKAKLRFRKDQQDIILIIKDKVNQTNIV